MNLSSEWQAITALNHLMENSYETLRQLAQAPTSERSPSQFGPCPAFERCELEGRLCLISGM